MITQPTKGEIAAAMIDYYKELQPKVFSTSFSPYWKEVIEKITDSSGVKEVVIKKPSSVGPTMLNINK